MAGVHGIADSQLALWHRKHTMAFALSQVQKTHLINRTCIPPLLIHPKWLISRRMVEISQSVFRNFFSPSEFE
jgi:hypothetical protein